MALAMDAPGASAVATGLAILVGVYVAVSAYTNRRLHPQEPPVIAPRIPVVGHVLEMALQGGRYVKSIG